jgi:hypothetical protein
MYKFIVCYTEWIDIVKGRIQKIAYIVCALDIWVPGKGKFSTNGRYSNKIKGRHSTAGLVCQLGIYICFTTFMCCAEERRIYT